MAGLKEEERFAVDNLKKRKEIIKVEIVKDKTAELTSLGKKLIKQGIKVEGVIDRLTPNLIIGDAWKKKKFRRQANASD